jgi:Flp pilus assembly protein TadG
MRRPRDDRGAVTVEFALVGPLAILLVSAVAGLGLVAAWSAFAESAARAGARFAAVKASQGTNTPGATPLQFPSASGDASVSSDGSLAVDPDGTVHARADAEASGSAEASATTPPIPDPPDPDALDANPDRTDAVCNGSRPYPSAAEVAAKIRDKSVFLGKPDSVLYLPSTPNVPGSCPHEGDLFTVTVTYHVPGVESILKLAGLGGLGTVTQTVSGRRE